MFAYTHTNILDQVNLQETVEKLQGNFANTKAMLYWERLSSSLA